MQVTGIASPHGTEFAVARCDDGKAHRAAVPPVRMAVQLAQVISPHTSGVFPGCPQSVGGPYPGKPLASTGSPTSAGRGRRWDVCCLRWSRPGHIQGQNHPGPDVGLKVGGARREGRLAAEVEPAHRAGDLRRREKPERLEHRRGSADPIREIPAHAARARPCRRARKALARRARPLPSGGTRRRRRPAHSGRRGSARRGSRSPGARRSSGTSWEELHGGGAGNRTRVREASGLSSFTCVAAASPAAELADLAAP